MFIETRDVLGGNAKRLNIDKDVWRMCSIELSEYLGKDIEEVSIEFWNAKVGLDENEQRAIEKEPSAANLETYYRNTKKYLYECICWEAYKIKQRNFKKIYLALKKFGVCNVLDFGAGTGGLILYLSKRGIKCDYLDVEGETLRFAKRRFKKNGFDVSIRRDIKECPRDFYGAVISDNVFEHLFNLEDVIREINKVLCPGGFLIARSSFGGGGVHLRKNDQYSQFDNYDRLMRDRGFGYRGQLKDDPLTRMIDRYVKNYWMLYVDLRRRRKYGGNFLVHQRLHEKEV